MGYTHYWRIDEAIVPKVWALISADAKSLFAASPEPLVFEHGSRKPPVADARSIRFNAGENRGYEDFLLQPAATNDRGLFCKTAQQPYDLVVCAMLAAARDRSKAITVTSDGGTDDWAPALAWASKVLGRPIGDPVARKKRKN
jgi:hypothetical protein